MALVRGFAIPTITRFGVALLFGGLVALLTLAAAACGGEGSETTGANGGATNTSTLTSATIYSSPT